MMNSSSFYNQGGGSGAPSSAAIPASQAATAAAAAAVAATTTTTRAAAAAAAVAIQDAMVIIPDEDKAAYFEALQKAPELVQRESDPSRFLECERKDPWKAAKRLACYWKHRKDIFGAERAFLPLHQTGGARTALNEDDLEILNTGVLVVLPNDAKGRSVMASDGTRLGPAHTFPHYTPAKLRAIFYILSVMSENRASQQQGIVLISLIATAPHNKEGKRFFTLIHEAFPFAAMEVHIIFLPSRAAFGSFIKKIMDHALHLLNYFAAFATFHQGQTDEEVIRKLKAQGFSKTCIPEWMGGSWKEQEFGKWKKQRIQYEQGLMLTEQEKLQRKRQLNASQSRKSRQRQKSQVSKLEEECATLRIHNEQLTIENRQLEQHLEYARNEAAILDYLEQKQQQQQQQQPAAAAAASGSGGGYGNGGPNHPLLSVGAVEAAVAAENSSLMVLPTDDAALWNLFDS